jgi:hypothetical protein
MGAFDKIEPGVTEGCYSVNINNEGYHALKDRLSPTGMKSLLQSPAHFKYGERKETEDMLMGIAFHMLMLEPDLFKSTYTDWAGKRIGKDYTAFAEDNPGKIILQADQMMRLKGMRNSILSYRHIDFERVFNEGKNEFTIFWQDEETGVDLKSRQDTLLGNVIFDLKKTQDARPHKFVHRCVDLMYDVQVAHNKEAARRFLGEDVKFYFIAVEDVAPYGVMIYESTPEMEAKGEASVRKAIDLYAKCKRENRWPGYDAQPMDIKWPEWACIK